MATPGCLWLWRACDTIYGDETPALVPELDIEFDKNVKLTMEDVNVVELGSVKSLIGKLKASEVL